MKKTISKALVMAMVVSSMLVGCGKKDSKPDVSAEELLNGVKETAEKGGDYNDMGMTFDVAGKIDAGALTGESAEPTLMEAALSGTMTVKMDADTTNTEGSVTIKMMGIEQPQEVKTWTQKNEDGTMTSYEFDTDSNSWTFTTDTAEEEKAEEATSDDIKDIVDAIKDCKVEQNSDGYKITGSLDLNKIMEKAKETEAAAGVDFDSVKQYTDKLNIKVAIDFDKDKNLKNIEISVDKIEEEAFVLEKAVITINVNSLAGETALDVPEDVTSNAKEAEF